MLADKPEDSLQVLMNSVLGARVKSVVKAIEAADGLPAPKLPTALTIGRNAEQDIAVYYGIKAGKPTYCGVTCDLPRRFAEHSGRFDELRMLGSGTLTRGEARAVEQALIVRNPNFANQINSISPRHQWYSEAVNWGEWWLKMNGY